MIAGFGLGQVIWSLLGLIVLALWFLLVARAMIGILASSMSGPRKVAWFCFVGFLPIVGAVTYLAVCQRPPDAAGPA